LAKEGQQDLKTGFPAAGAADSTGKRSIMISSIRLAGIVNVSDMKKSLDPVRLQELEQSFRIWANNPGSANRRLSRKRIFLIFLLIRYTGARLSEILNLDFHRDVDCSRRIVRLRKSAAASDVHLRDVQIPELLAQEIQTTLRELPSGKTQGKLIKVDPAHVRRKFYERAEAVGFPRESGTPEVIRRSRAVELMQSNVPLPLVQKILGHSTPNLAASYVEFSEKDLRRVERFYVEREDRRKTSARNAFFGKIEAVTAGDVQTMVEVVSLGGQRVRAVITNYSQTRLGLKPGSLVAAEVKAPWVVLYKAEAKPACTAENRFRGTVSRIVTGRVTSEVVVRIADGTELCSILTEKSRRLMGIKVNDVLWAAFSAFAVVIHAD
jgi:molybdate transport system regulatory protein